MATAAAVSSFGVGRYVLAVLCHSGTVEEGKMRIASSDPASSFYSWHGNEVYNRAWVKATKLWRSGLGLSDISH